MSSIEIEFVVTWDYCVPVLTPSNSLNFDYTLGQGVLTNAYSISESACGYTVSYSLTPAAPSYMTLDTTTVQISIDTSNKSHLGSFGYTLTGSVTR